jgi:hypothetical protein
MSRQKFGTIDHNGPGVSNMKYRLNQIEVSRDYELIEEAHIYKRPILNLILAALLQSPFLGSEQNNPRLNNDDAVTLASSCLPESVIVRVIEVYEDDFDTSHAALSSLRKRCVGEKIIGTMLSKRFRANATALTATTQDSAA